MKRVKLLFLGLSIVLQVSGQSLVDTYKSGTLKLVQDTEYAKENSWGEIFSDYKQKVNGMPVGLYKSIAVAPDGSVFVGNYNSYSISKFNLAGKHVLTFGSKGTSEQDFKVRPVLGGVVGGKYVFTHEHNGHIKLFTLNGEFVKNIKLDYMPLKTVSLSSNRIALVGHVPMGEKGVRYVITIIDPDSGEANVIKKYDDVWDNPNLTISKNSYLYSYSPFSTTNRMFIRGLPDGNLLVGFSFSNQLSVYSPSGKHMRDIALDYPSLPYPEDLKKEFIARMEAMVEQRDGFTKADIAPIYREDFFRKTMPYYYNLLVDDEGNILVFRFIDEEVDHLFRVYTYSSNGKWVGDAIVDLSGFKLGLNYKYEEIAFHNKHLYGILQPSTDEVVPPQLVKFGLKGK